MIKVEIFRNENKEIYGFYLNDHCDSIVCSAVSAIALNTVNSIEAFTDEKFICEYEEKGGFLHITLPELKNGKLNHDVTLLLNSFVLGLNGIKQQYKKQIKIIDNKEVR